MKKLNKRSEKPHGIILLMAILFLLSPGCLLEELPQPFPVLEECLDSSQGGFPDISIDEDTVIWTWGKIRNELQIKGMIEGDHQPIVTGSE